MFVVVGRFRFRRMGQDEQQSMLQRWEQDFAPIARESPGFRGVHFVWLSDDEMMTDWHWDSEADWDAAQARFGPFLRQHVVPNLAQPPERVAARSSYRSRPEVWADVSGAWRDC
jgi:hypothetical protein